MSLLTPLDDLYEQVHGWAGAELLPVHFAMSSYLTTYLPGKNERTWAVFCGGPSNGKSIILGAFVDKRLDGKDGVAVRRDNITANAFSSTYRDENTNQDPSLLYVLKESREPHGRKVLILPELSAIIAQREKAAIFFGDLRAVYEGTFHKQCGSIGADLKDDVIFGCLMAGTEKLDEYARENQNLGERTLTCRIGRHLRDINKRKAGADHASRSDRLTKGDTLQEINRLTLEIIRKARIEIARVQGRVTRPDPLRDRVSSLATVAASVRASPISSKSYAFSPEHPARFTEQLNGLADVHAIVCGRDTWNEEDYTLVLRIAQDTMHPDSLKAINVLWRGGPDQAKKGLQVSEIDTLCRSEYAIHRNLRQWEDFEVTRSFESASSYSLHPKFIRLVDHCDFLKGITL